MQSTEQIEALDALLKSLDKSIKKLRSEYQYASATVKNLKRAYQEQDAGALRARFENYRALRRERHNQLADLVPACRQARIWVMQARNERVTGSFGSVAEPLLGWLFELALMSVPLPDEHSLWDTPVGPFMHWRSELPVVNQAYARGGRRFEGYLHVLRSKESIPLRTLRPFLLQAMGLPCAALASSEMHEDTQFTQFLETRAWLQRKLPPEDYELVRTYRNFL